MGISQPDDIVQLHPDLKPFWYEICSHYQRVGLSHSQQIIWDLNSRHLGGHIGYQPSVFFYGPNQFCNWGDHQWLTSVDYINSKNNFIALAHQLGTVVPRTQCFNSVSEITTEIISNQEYPCYLKAAVSVAGVGIYRCENANQMRTSITRFEPSTPVQIQEEIKADKFLNLQYQVINDEVIRLAASEQILDGFAHQGNRVPASHEPWNYVDDMAVELKEQGLKGIFAFDLAVVQTEQGLRFPVIECNPRYNGATYPTLIAQKLGITQWSAKTFSTRHRNLRQLAIQGLEYNHKTGEGLIIVNWGTISYGKLMILLAGSEEYQEALSGELDACL